MPKSNHNRRTQGNHSGASKVSAHRSKERLNLPFVGIPSFYRFPVCHDLETLNADIAFLGVPFDEGTLHRPGSRLAPRYIRDASLRTAPKNGEYFDINRKKIFLKDQIENNRIWDCGDTDIRYSLPMDTFKNLSNDVATILLRGALPVVVGGDHSITYPIVRAYATDPIDLVVIDGHLDFSDSRMGVTHASGNPLRRCSELPNVRKIVHVGIRGIRLTKKDYDAAIENGNVVITDANLRKHGIVRCLKKAFPLKNVYVSVDVDGLDPIIAPGTSGLEPGGVRYDEAITLFEMLTEHAPIIGFDINEVNPFLDPSYTTAVLATNLIMQFLFLTTSARHWRNRKLIPSKQWL
jgi:agmatinase